MCHGEDPVLVFLLQLRDSIRHGAHVYLFTVFTLLVWFLWVIKMVLSSRYRPWTTPYEVSTAVVIPVVDEPLDLFRDVLRRIAAQHPSDVLVVINGPQNPGLAAACDQAGIRWHHTPVAGKRNAVRVGVERTVGDVVVLVDSDTLWTERTLPELVKPFADPRVGGVTTRQRIIGHDRTILTRWADWLESLRCHYSMPAMSVLGTVGCLPGRTIAFRREILVRAMPAFLTERFLGIVLEVSDDRTLTNYTLKYGYRSVYQSTSFVLTDAPTRFRKLVKQQYRWARGSQYNTLRMLPWMLRHARTLALFYAADILLPFLLLGSAIGWVERSQRGQHHDLYAGLLGKYGAHHGLVIVAAITVLGSVLSVTVRQWRHLRERPLDLLFLPAYLLLSTLMLMPIRIYGLFRCGHAAGWGTRAHAYDGDQAAVRTSPAVAVPYLLGLTLITAGALYHG